MLDLLCCRTFALIFLSAAAPTSAAAFAPHPIGAEVPAEGATRPPLAVVASVLAVPGLLLLCPTAAGATDGGDALRGAELFSANCASCHAGGQNFVNEKRTLKRDALEKFLGGYDQATLRKFLGESARHRNQAYFRAPGGKLSEVDWDDASAYVAATAYSDGW